MSEVVQFMRPGDRRLGRHVNHDPRSRLFPRRADPNVEIRTTRHVRHIPVFDQGNLGSCTGNAALGCMGTGIFFATVDKQEQQRYPFTEEGAVAIYSAATAIDPFSGQYPPEDTGSDGLSVAKVLQAAGWISGYRHAFTMTDFVGGLMRQPCIVGTWWTDDMFSPDADGIIHPTGTEAGGHEYVADGYVTKGDLFGAQNRPAPADLVSFTNSWGDSWGHRGRFYMPATEFNGLLSRQGDATFFVPSDAPPPEPEPAEDPDAVLAAAVGRWARNTTVSASSKRARKAVRTWLDAKGL